MGDVSWRGAVSGASEVEGSGLSFRGAIAGGGDGLQNYIIFFNFEKECY